MIVTAPFRRVREIHQEWSAKFPDRDRVYGAAVARRLRAMGIRDKPIAPGSPWQNAFAERLIRSIRRECVDHMVVVFAENLVRLMTESLKRRPRWSRCYASC